MRFVYETPEVHLEEFNEVDIITISLLIDGGLLGDGDKTAW